MAISEPVIVDGWEQSINLTEVIKRTGYNRFQLIRFRKEQGFPDPILGKYLWSEIVTWQQKMKDARNVKSNGDREKNEVLLLELKRQVREITQKLAA